VHVISEKLLLRLQNLEKGVFVKMHKNSRNYTQKLDPKLDPKSKQKPRNTLKFTHLTIQNLKPRPKRVTFWCRGMDDFGIKVFPSGFKSWIYEYRFDNKTRRMTLGRFPKTSLSEATKLYVQTKEKVDHGIDPLEERFEKQNTWKSEPTVDDLIKLYIEHCKNTNKKTYKEEERALKKELPKDIRHMKISEVPPKRLAKIVDEIIARGSSGMAVHFFRYTRRMFNFAIDRTLMEHNPCSKIKVKIHKKNRQRHLSPKEIYLFWHNLENVPMSQVKRLMLKFLLCTVSRPIEIREMKWSHINLDQKIWTLPTTKNGRLHRVYLGDLAIQVLKEVKDYTGDYDLVFGSAGCKTLTKSKNDRIKELKPLTINSLAQTVRRHFDVFGIEEQFYPYDLRRTGATMIAGLFGRRDFASLALNHTTSDVTGIYDQYTYDREKKMMLNALNKAIGLIINSSTVESVPDFEALRNKIIQPVNAPNLTVETPVDNSQGLASSFSNPVTYTLSYVHDDLK